MLRVPLVTTLVIACLVIAYQVWSFMGAGRKLASLEPPPAAREGYAITLAFPPERFHQQVMQDRGRVVGVKDRTVFIMDVDPAALREIAGRYWVESIARWKPS